MRNRRGADLLLLVLSGALLAFGGGFGCDPELDGVDFRAASFLVEPDDPDSPRNYYMAFTGKKLPGDGWAVLPYPMKPAFAVRAQMGVFLEEALGASEDAEGCLGFRNSGNLSEEFRICVTYALSPARTVVYSNLDLLTVDCLGATRVDLELTDDGIDVRARYRCPVDATFQDLTSVASQYTTGEKWFALTGAYNLGRGAQIGFDAFEIDTVGPFDDSTEAAAAFGEFSGFRLGLSAFYELEGENLGGAQTNAATATLALQGAYQQSVNGDLFDASTQKFATKAFMSYAKLSDGLFEGKEAKYFKSFPKLAGVEACAMEGMVPFF